MATIRYTVIDQKLDDHIAGSFRAKAHDFANPRRNAGMLHESFWPDLPHMVARGGSEFLVLFKWRKRACGS